jgi:hypothetical protein
VGCHFEAALSLLKAFQRAPYTRPASDSIGTMSRSPEITTSQPDLRTARESNPFVHPGGRDMTAPYITVPGEEGRFRTFGLGRRGLDPLANQDYTKDQEQNRHDCRIVLSQPDFPSIQNPGRSIS